MTTANECATLIEVLQAQAKHWPDGIAYTFLPDDESAQIDITYRQLDQAARAIAVTLSQHYQTGDRALMFYPAGLEFIKAFFGCLYAGLIAVPAYPPRRNRKIERVQILIDDARPTVILSTETLTSATEPYFSETPTLSHVRWIATDMIDSESADDWNDPDIPTDALAFLQYSSGSTGTPKGVMVSHGNVIANQKMITSIMDTGKDDVSVGWLPMFHDMGLIGMLLHPLYIGCPSVFMSPTAFLRKPARWLQAITDFGGTGNSAPNFAFDHCMRAIPEHQRSSFDLSTWRVALSGAEPVRPATLERFAETFAPYGFRKEAFMPAYGLAEATLIVSGTHHSEMPVIESFSSNILEQSYRAIAAEGLDDCRRLTSNGKPTAHSEIKIVDPETCVPLNEQGVGEIWVHGPHVAQGYWNMEEATARDFNAKIVGDADKTWLRTGDLGFLMQQELFVTGRIKDLIIIGGRNHYPQDLEWTIAALGVDGGPLQGTSQDGSVAAFSTEEDDDEKLIIVIEVSRAYQRDMNLIVSGRADEVDFSPRLPKPDQVFLEVRRTLAENHQLQVHDVVLLKTGTLPKTSSGKIQRFRCRQEYQDFSLNVLWSDRASTEKTASSITASKKKRRTRTPSNQDASSARPSRTEIQEWIRVRCAELLGLDPELIELDQDLASYGLNSIAAMQLVGEMEAWLDTAIPHDILWEEPNIIAIVESLAEVDNEEQPALPQLPTITPNIQERYHPFSLNPIQEAYWLGRSDAFEMGNVACHFYAEHESTILDIPRLSLAWQKIVARHDMLRAVITSSGEQKILSDVPPYEIEVIDMRSLDSEEKLRCLTEFRDKMSCRVPDPEKWPLFELRAHQIKNNRIRIHISFDLLIADVASLLLILREWRELYNNISATLPALELSYRDYVIAETTIHKTELYQHSLRYWEQRAPSLPDGPQLPLATNPANIRKPHFVRRELRLPESEWNALKERAQEYGLTPSMVVCAVYAEVLKTWSKDPHFTLNLTLFNRHPVHPEVNALVGDFTSILLLEVDYRGSEGFGCRAMRLQEQLRADLEHRIVNGIDVLRERARVQGSGSRATMPVIFTSSLGIKAMHGFSEDDADWLGPRIYGISQTPQVWLDHQVSEDNGTLVCAWDAVEELFPEDLLDHMFESFHSLLQRLSRASSAWDQRQLALTPQEHLEVWARVNTTNGTLPHGLLHSGVLEQTERRGNAPAVITTDMTLSYYELGQRTHALAAKLRAQGIGPNDLVPVIMHKGWEQIVSALAIIEAGGAYVPIDASLPPQRITTLIEISEAKLALTCSDIDSGLEWPQGFIRHNVDQETPPQQPVTALSPVQCETDLAYVIYTSGSTGVPKGVMIDHRGALNTVYDINERFNVDETQRVLGVSSFSFDLSVYDIFGLLSVGGRLILPDSDKINDPEHLLTLMRNEGITLWNSAPAVIAGVLEYAAGHMEELPSTLHLAMFSGDWIPTHVPDELKRLFSGIEVFSLGGATEASIWSIIYPIDHVDPEWRSIPYGTPLKNQTFHVLDANLEPRPEWVTGALYIGGVGLAKGYWKDEDKTNASFITHPRSGERLYYTGDLGRYMPGGIIEFLGREDSQVKIQGFRIELGEIEAVLNHHPAITDAVVKIYEDGGGQKQLAAYVVPLLSIDRIEVDLPAVATDASGTSHLLRVTDLSQHELRLSNCPGTWGSDLSLNIQIQLPDSLGKLKLSAQTVWVNNDTASLRIQDEPKVRSELLQLISLVAESESCSDLSHIRRFCYRSADVRRTNFRVPFAHSVTTQAGGLSVPVDIIDISRDGAGIDDIPDTVKPGDELILPLPLSEHGETTSIRTTVCWCDERRAGVRFDPTTEDQLRALNRAIVHQVHEHGYWIPENNTAHLRDHLGEHLPHYMIPRVYTILKNLPLNNNGKVDRKALPTPRQQVADAVAPRTELETSLAEIWIETLGVASIGVHDNFFELGGYSQLAVRLLLKIRDKLQIDLPIRALFEHQTIESLAAHIEHLKAPAASDSGETQSGNQQSLYGEFARRGIYDRIQVINSDKHYHRASGLMLTYKEDGRSHTVLDMVGGYGSTLLGHNHPELTSLISESLSAQLPVHAQHTDNIDAGMLAKALSDRVGRYTGQSYVTTLASTGTEAIEAAIKHAKMAFHTRASVQERNDRNLSALLIHQEAKNQIQIAEDVYLELDKITGRHLVRNPSTLVDAILEHNQKIYQIEPLFVALNHAFHGMTSGSLGLTASPDFRKPFQWMGITSCWIDHSQIALKQVISDHMHSLITLNIDKKGHARVETRHWQTIGGLFIEPIQGEGGIHIVDSDFAHQARSLADQHGFPIIIDEIQCGMGRSGTFCAAEQLGLRGDYYTFAKTLGGGLSKISALLVEESQYQKDFGYYHGSTFAEDPLSCRVALKTLEIIDRDELITMAAHKGHRFLERLQALAEGYPDVIAEVRGLGLMIGLELASLKDSPSFLFRSLATGGMEIMNHLISGFLLNRRGIRIAPTKTRNTIRFLPSVYITEEDMDRVIRALESICKIVRFANPGYLLRYIVEVGDTGLDIADWRDKHPPWHDDLPGSDPLVAHIGHLEDDDSLLLAEPSLAEVPASKHEQLLEALFPVSQPAITQQLRVTSSQGESTHLSIIGLPLTGRLFERMLDSELRDLVLEKIDDAVDLAREIGCTVVGFGGYTSIATINCTTVATPDLVLTSGNSYTTALAVQALKQSAQEKGLNLEKSRIGVLGGKGNIGSIAARILAEDCSNIILFGRKGSEEGLREVACSIYDDAWQQIKWKQHLTGVADKLEATMLMKRLRNAAFGPDTPAGEVVYDGLLRELGNDTLVRVSTNLSELADCDIIISATSSSQPVIFPEHLSETTRIICDISTPSDVAPEVMIEFPGVEVLSGGLARLPGSSNTKLLGTRLPPGHVYGCVAETTLLGILGYHMSFSFGEMDKTQVHFIANAAEHHGYGLGPLKREVTPEQREQARLDKEKKKKQSRSNSGLKLAWSNNNADASPEG